MWVLSPSRWSETSSYSYTTVSFASYYPLVLYKSFVCAHVEEKNIFTPEGLLNFGDPAAAVAHQVEHVFLRWERRAGWPPSSLKLAPTSRWSVSGWLTHTHAARRLLLGNRSAHRNRDSLTQSNEDWPVFHCNLSSTRLFRGTKISPLGLCVTPAAGEFRPCAKGKQNLSAFLRCICWGLLICSSQFGMACFYSVPHLSGLHKKETWSSVPPPRWSCFENCPIINIYTKSYLQIPMNSILSKSRCPVDSLKISYAIAQLLLYDTLTI